jgi:RNA polymerase sigma-70 factor (ECF subfamily)
VAERNLITELITQYSAGIRHLDRYRRSLDRADPNQDDEARTVSGMLSDMRYALDWMRRGRRPGSRKGAERRDIYRRRELLASTEPMTEEERRRLIDCVAVMTERELTCWLLHMAHGLTFQEIGDRLGLSRRTVQQYVERARKKVLDVQMTCV